MVINASLHAFQRALKWISWSKAGRIKEGNMTMWPILLTILTAEALFQIVFFQCELSHLRNRPARAMPYTAHLFEKQLRLNPSKPTKNY